MADNIIERAGITLDTSGVESGVQRALSALGRLGSFNQQAAQSSESLARSLNAVNRATVEGNEELAAYMNKLAEQAETVAMSAGELAQYRARMLGATEAEAQHARTLGDTIAVQKEQMANEERMDRLLSSVATRALIYGAIYGAIRLTS